MAIENFKVDTVHSSVGFTIRHLMISKVHGVFTKWNGTFAFDEENPAASHVEVTIDVASIDTREPQRDGHLRTKDFFDAETFPQATFKSTKVEGAKDSFKVTGDLTLHGVTKPVVLDVEFTGRAVHPQAGARAAFTATSHINRKDFGITFNQVLDAGGVALSEKVDLVFEIQGGKA